MNVVGGWYDTTYDYLYYKGLLVFGMEFRPWGCQSMRLGSIGKRLYHGRYQVIRSVLKSDSYRLQCCYFGSSTIPDRSLTGI